MTKVEHSMNNGQKIINIKYVCMPHLHRDCCLLEREQYEAPL